MIVAPMVVNHIGMRMLLIMIANIMQPVILTLIMLALMASIILVKIFVVQFYLRLDTTIIIGKCHIINIILEFMVFFVCACIRKIQLFLIESEIISKKHETFHSIEPNQFCMLFTLNSINKSNENVLGSRFHSLKCLVFSVFVHFLLI